MASIARRLDDDRRRLVIVTSKPLVGQVAYLPLDLAEAGPGGDAVVKLRHNTIGHLLGARRQSMTRVVAELKRRGLIEAHYGHTVVLDADGLHRVMGSEPPP